MSYKRRSIDVSGMVVFCVLCVQGGVLASAQDLLTQHNDNFRTGANLNETLLTSANVTAAQFGKLFARLVDGDIYAQPLYVSGVSIPGHGIKNVVYVATANNNIYAFDADNYDPDPSHGALWGPFHLGDPELGRQSLTGQLPSANSCPSASAYGVISTPVIDKANNWLYLVAKVVDPTGHSHQMLHRLDIRTGAGTNLTPNNTPIEIMYPEPTNHQPNKDYGSFNPTQINRAGLLLSQGVLYVAFAEHCDFIVGGVPHGWVLAYNASTLLQTGAFNTTPHAQRGGIWQSGNGLAADRHGNIFFHTGNMGNLGEPPRLRDSTDFSQSIVRINPTLNAPVTFPHYSEPPPWYLDYHRLDSQDLDVTSSGPLLMPEAINGDLIGGGKTGRLYLLDRANMSLKQTFRASVNNSGSATPENCTYGPDHYGPGTPAPANGGETLCPHIHSGLVYWHGPEGDIARVYVWGERDYLRAYRYDTKQTLFVKSDGTPFGTSDDLSAPSEAVRGSLLNPLHDPNDGSRVMPGPTMAISANGNHQGSGILWATMVLRDNAEYKNVDGILRAFDALTLEELWNSGTDVFGPEFLGKYAKYSAATIANGTVFVPTFSNRLVAYGPISRRQTFRAPWQQFEQINPGVDSLSTRAAISVLARNPQQIDLYLTDAHGVVRNGGWWTAGDQYHDGYPISPPGFALPNTPVSAIARTGDTADLYVVRTDGSVWNAGWWSAQTNHGQWNPGYPIPGAGPGFATPGAPVSAAARNPSTADLYVVRSDGSVWNAGWWSAQINHGQWNPGYPIPGAGPGFARTGTRVQVVNRTPDITDLYVVRSDGSVWNAGWWSEQANNGNWNPGYAIPSAGPGFATPGAPVSAAARNPDTVDLYVVRVDGSVWNAGWWSAQSNNGNWNPGYAIPGAGPGFALPSAAVTIINRTPDMTDLFVVRADGSVWNAGWWSAQANSGRWNPGYSLGMPISVDPNAAVSGVSRNSGHTDLFVPGRNTRILSPWWDQNVR